TRFSRDWSSDVCSSDLPQHFLQARREFRALGEAFSFLLFRQRRGPGQAFGDFLPDQGLAVLEPGSMDAVDFTALQDTEAVGPEGQALGITGSQPLRWREAPLQRPRDRGEARMRRRHHLLHGVLRKEKAAEGE